MCGICGVINLENHRVEETLIRRMMKTMKHRGPDDEGVFIENNIGFGFVRLSILDLSPAGHQPMISEDKKYVIIFNGEIYNYIELREELKELGYRFKTQTDTEVLLISYLHWGEECLNYLNGMWAFVVYDRHNKKLFASRDRYGIKPFYYLQTDKIFAFASEIPPLLNLLPGAPTPDNLSIFDYLIFNRTDQTEKTFFNEIKKLQHGHNITFNSSIIKSFNISFKKWYDLKESIKFVDGFGSSEEFHRLFADAVKIRLRSDVQVGVCLSGGLDSSSIVSCILNDCKKEDLQTFSVIFGEGVQTDEGRFMRLYENLVQKQHYNTINAHTFVDGISDFVGAIAEPVPSGGPFAQFNVMKIAQGNAVVLLDGQGADEILGGYKYFWGYYFIELIKQIKLVELIKELKAGNDNIYKLSTALFYLLPPHFQTKLRSNKLDGFISKKFIVENSTISDLSNSLYQASNLNEALYNHLEYKLEHLLKWEDRNSMWFGLEARVPFLDYRVVEKSIRTKSCLLMHRGYTKTLLREAMKNEIPKQILERKEKIGFGAPKKDWFRNYDASRYIGSVINQNDTFLSEYFELSKLNNAISSHLKGNHDYSPIIWKAFNLALWHEQNFQNV